MSVTLKRITAFENEQQSGAAYVIKWQKKKSSLKPYCGLMMRVKMVDCILYLRGQKLYHWC